MYITHYKVYMYITHYKVHVHVHAQNSHFSLAPHGGVVG